MSTDLLKAKCLPFTDIQKIVSPFNCMCFCVIFISINETDIIEKSPRFKMEK